MLFHRSRSVKQRTTPFQGCSCHDTALASHHEATRLSRSQDHWRPVSSWLCRLVSGVRVWSWSRISDGRPTWICIDPPMVLTWSSRARALARSHARWSMDSSGCSMRSGSTTYSSKTSFSPARASARGVWSDNRRSCLSQTTRMFPIMRASLKNRCAKAGGFLLR